MQIPTRSPEGMGKLCFNDPELAKLLSTARSPKLDAMTIANDEDDDYDSIEDEEESEGSEPDGNTGLVAGLNRTAQLSLFISLS
jgi:hypothetical protein